MRKDRFARSSALVAILLLGFSMAAGAAHSAGTLHGLFYDSTLESYVMGTIEPASGTVSLYGTGISAKWISGDTMAIDAADGVAYVVAGPNSGASSNRSIYTMDIMTGNQTASHALIDNSAPTIPGTLSNPFAIAYDATSRTYYALVQDPRDPRINGQP